MKTARWRQNAKQKKSGQLGRYANVLNVYMEEFPLVSDWRVLTSTPNIVVVPFFISDGLHSYEDIPGFAWNRRIRLLNPKQARYSATDHTTSMAGRCFMPAQSARTRESLTSSSNWQLAIMNSLPQF